MAYRTKYGKHYHETYGCHGATIPCDTKGLTPCSDCCGDKGDGAGAGNATGGVGGGGAIAVDSEIIGVTDVKVGGVKGTLYKLDRLLDPEERKAISELEGARTVIIAAQYAPEIKRTGVFVEDGYSYSIGRAEEIAEAGISAMTDPAAAPDIDLSPRQPSAPATEPSVSNGEIDRLMSQFEKEYDTLYQADVDGRYVAGYDEAYALGEELLRTRPDLVKAFVQRRGDFISSDREVAAFGFAFGETMGDGSKAAEIPSIDVVDPSDSRMLTVAAWREASEGREERAEVARYIAKEKQKEDILLGLQATMRTDPDVSDEAGYIARQLNTLLDACDVRKIEDGKRDSYTTTLASQYVVFAAANEGYIGGSEADYCASHAMDALAGYEIRLRDDADADQILARMRRGIDGSALYKDREYGELGSAGVPIFRTRNLDEERASQAAEGDRLSKMSSRARRKMWQEEADKWASTWAASREIRGEGRNANDVLRSYQDFSRAKNSAADESRMAVAASDPKIARRYGDAYTEAMADERQRAYSTAASKALRTLSSRKQMAEQHARLQTEALHVVETTREYDETTPLRRLHPEDRRQLARTLAKELEPTVTPSNERAKATALETVLDGGTVGDLRDLVDTNNPVSLVDMACADALIRMRFRGQASHRETSAVD